MSRQTPPYSVPNTPIIGKDALPLISTPKSTSEVTSTPTLNIPENLTQELVEAMPELKRWQEDLLILTGFNDNSTLHWRPSWFAQSGYATGFWTLHNPPDVVTELLPMKELGRSVMTRRMRRYDDAPAPYIKSWDHWYRYCEMYGVPVDFLCEEQITFMRLGLSKAGSVRLHEPPSHPLYPEPQPLGLGRYILDRDMYYNLPRKFHQVNDDEIVVVHSNGALEIVHADFAYFHDSQWTHYSGRGGYVHDWWYTADDDIENLKVQGVGRRWAYLPWTMEQELSCRPMRLKLRLRMSTEPPNTIPNARNGLYAKSRDSPIGSGVSQEHVTDIGGVDEMKDHQEYLRREYESDSDAEADIKEDGQESESHNHTSGDHESESDADDKVFDESGNEQEEDDRIQVVEEEGMDYEYEHEDNDMLEDGMKDRVALSERYFSMKGAKIGGI